MGSSAGLPEKPESGRKKVKISNFGREEHIKQGVSFSEIADSSIDWTSKLTPWNAQRLKNRLMNLILIIVKFC